MSRDRARQADGSRCWGSPIRRGGRQRPIGVSGPARPRRGRCFDQPEPEELIELTVIVPARNEEDCLGACLQSLVSQSEEIFELGRDWELVVVDDHSTDRTAEIARGFAGVTRDASGQSWSRAGRARPTRFGRRHARREAAGCCLPMRIRSTSRAICAGRFMRQSGTRRVC